MTDLSKESVDALKRSYKQAKIPREKERYQALWLKARGYRRDEICELLGIGPRSLGRWIQTYLKLGLSGLRDKPQRGNNRKLTTERKDQIKEIIHQQTPQEAGLTGRFWDVRLLQQLIQTTFKVSYSALSCQRLFKWCGFTYHQPDRVNNRQSAKSKKEFEEKLKKSFRGIAREMGWSW